MTTYPETLEAAIAEIERMKSLHALEVEKTKRMTRERDASRAMLEEEQCYGVSLRLPPVPPRHVDGLEYIEGNQYPMLNLTESIIPSGGEGRVMHLAIEGDALSVIATVGASGGDPVDLIIVQPDGLIPKDELGDRLASFSADLQLAKSVLAPTGSIFLFVESEMIHRYKEIGDHIFGESNAHPFMAWKKKTNAQNTGAEKGKIADSLYAILGWHGESGAVRPVLDRTTDDGAYSNFDERGCYRILREQQVRQGSYGYGESAVFSILGVSPKPGHSWKRDEEDVLRDISAGIIEVRGGAVYKRVYKDDDQSVKAFGSDITSASELEEDDSDLPVILDGKVFPSMATASTALTKMVGKHNLRGILSVGVVKFLVRKFTPRGDERVMDFYAGSGTLLEAVASLNSKDGGSRQAIVSNERAVVTMGSDDENRDIVRGVIVPRARLVLDESQGLYVMALGSISVKKLRQVKRSQIADWKSEAILTTQPALLGIALLRERIVPSSVEVNSRCSVIVDDAGKRVILVWSNANTAEVSLLGESMIGASERLSLEYPGYERSVYFADRNTESSKYLSIDAENVIGRMRGWKATLPCMEYASTMDANRDGLILARRTSTVEMYADHKRRIQYGTSSPDHDE